MSSSKKKNDFKLVGFVETVSFDNDDDCAVKIGITIEKDAINGYDYCFVP